MAKRELMALWLVAALVFAAFSGGATTALLADSEEMHITITAGNAGNSASTLQTQSVESSGDSADPAIDYVAFVSEDSEPGVSWSVDSRNEAGEPTDIGWTSNKDIDYVVVGYEDDGQRVNVYDYTNDDSMTRTVGSAATVDTLADVSLYSLESALEADQIAKKADKITEKRLSETRDVAGGATTVVVPNAVDDSYTTSKNGKLTVNAASGVLGNDDAIGAATLLDRPNNGEVTLNADGSFTYKPDKGFTGDDSFTYQLSDGDGVAADTATVTITVGK